MAILCRNEMGLCIFTEFEKFPIAAETMVHYAFIRGLHQASLKDFCWSEIKFKNFGVVNLVSVVVLMGHSRPLFVYFRSFEQALEFLGQINVKSVHPVHCAGS